MKKIILAVLALAFGISLSLAQEATPPVAPAVSKPAETKTITGKIESVSLADAAKGTKSEIVLVDNNGNKSTFLVKSTTTIYDADWKAAHLENIKKEDKVQVKYLTTKEGVSEAKSINLIK